MKKRVKLRAMTAGEFCRARKCETCPELLLEENVKHQSKCALYIDLIEAKGSWDMPYQDSRDRYILVRADG